MQVECSKSDSIQFNDHFEYSHFKQNFQLKLFELEIKFINSNRKFTNMFCIVSYNVGYFLDKRNLNVPSKDFVLNTIFKKSSAYQKVCKMPRTLIDMKLLVISQRCPAKRDFLLQLYVYIEDFSLKYTVLCTICCSCCHQKQYKTFKIQTVGSVIYQLI